jgi:hypothetical protein
MIYLTKDNNSGTEKWEAYSIDRLIISKVEERESNVFTIRIKLPRL